MNPTESKALLQIRDLSVSFAKNQREVRAVDSVSLNIQKGETLGLIGESGSGKTLTALSILGLVPQPQGTVSGRRISFEGTNLLDLSARQWQRIRGGQISMVFQDPGQSLNPVYRIGEQVAESLLLHREVKQEEVFESVDHWFRKLGLPSAEKIWFAYPHQLSGGMKQRVMMAMALIAGPKLFVADEPTTALDATVRMQIREILKTLVSDSQLSMLYISHDVSEVKELAGRTAVMYAGRIVEEGPTEVMMSSPRHPYTVGLLNSVPSLRGPSEALNPIPGHPPELGSLPPGCTFHPRCPFQMDICLKEKPVFFPTGTAHHASRCFLHDSGSSGGGWPL